MIKTNELIKKQNQEIKEYMSRNGEWSFHKFSDGSIRYIDSIFKTEPITVYEDALPFQPVRGLEELKKAVGVSSALVTINDFVKFDGSKVILADTEIRFYGVGVTVEYTGIRSLNVDYNHDLKVIIHSIKKGNFGEVVFINNISVKTCDIKVYNDGISVQVLDEYMEKYVTYSNIKTITDTENRIIY